MERRHLDSLAISLNFKWFVERENFRKMLDAFQLMPIFDHWLNCCIVLLVFLRFLKVRSVSWEFRLLRVTHLGDRRLARQDRRQILCFHRLNFWGWKSELLIHVFDNSDILVALDHRRWFDDHRRWHFKMRLRVLQRYLFSALVIYVHLWRWRWRHQIIIKIFLDQNVFQMHVISPILPMLWLVKVCVSSYVIEVEIAVVWDVPGGSLDVGGDWGMLFNAFLIQKSWSLNHRWHLAGLMRFLWSEHMYVFSDEVVQLILISIWIIEIWFDHYRLSLWFRNGLINLNVPLWFIQRD